MQCDNEEVDVYKPDQHGDEAVAQRQVDFVAAHGLPVVLAEETMVFEALPQGMEQFGNIPEHEEHPQQEHDIIQGYPEFSLANEGLLKDGMIQVVEFEDIQRPLGLFCVPK